MSRELFRSITDIKRVYNSICSFAAYKVPGFSFTYPDNLRIRLETRRKKCHNFNEIRILCKDTVSLSR